MIGILFAIAGACPLAAHALPAFPHKSPTSPAFDVRLDLLIAILNGSLDLAEQLMGINSATTLMWGQPVSAPKPPATDEPSAVTGAQSSIADARSSGVPRDALAATALVDGDLTPVPGTKIRDCSPGSAAAIHPNLRFIYRTSDAGTFGVVCALAYDPDTRKLSPITGSPYRAGTSTGAVAIDPSGTFLYATNEADNTVSAFAIDPAAGTLTAVDGSPFATGIAPRSIAIDRTGRFVYVANNTTNAPSASISGFAINVDSGALSPLPGSPYAAPSGAAGIAVEPTGRYVYLAASKTQAYAINDATGALTAIGAVQPFSSRIVADPTGRFVFATANVFDLVYAYAIAANGTLVAVDAGVRTGTNPVGASVDPSGRFLYVANLVAGSLSGYAIDNASGSLTSIAGFPKTIAPNLFSTVAGGALAPVAAAFEGQPFFHPIGVYGGYPPYTWTVAGGALPPGLSIDSTLGALRGTPTTRGQYVFTAKATDSRGTSVSTSYTFNVVPASVAGATPVYEFYNATLDNFFITADVRESIAVDIGNAGPGWSRTGEFFLAGGATQVCRFYGSISPGPNSHFYTIDPNECASLKQLQQTTPATSKRWNFESLDFASTVPAAGNCPAGSDPVYRAYNDGFARGVDSNHRITRSTAAIAQVVARGWKNEGVVMCAPSP